MDDGKLVRNMLKQNDTCIHTLLHYIFSAWHRFPLPFLSFTRQSCCRHCALHTIASLKVYLYVCMCKNTRLSMNTRNGCRCSATPLPHHYLYVYAQRYYACTTIVDVMMLSHCCAVLNGHMV